MPSIDLSLWYRTHGEAVLRRCRRLSSSDAEARDLLQETFLRAHRYKNSYAGGSPLSWLLTIADRLGYDAIRKARGRGASVDVDVDVTADGLEHGLAPLARRDLVRKLLHRTDERTALIVIRRYFDELSILEIAAELALNERTVRRCLLEFLTEARAFASLPSPKEQEDGRI